MPDTRQHRGPHSGDEERFAADRLPALRAAVADLGWLLGRGYSDRAALQLVGDRHRLDARQRHAVGRAACSAADALALARTRQRLGAFPELWLDGFNVLTTIEVALGGGAVLGCVDGCWRDLASRHGTWRAVDETVAAAVHLGEHLAGAGVERTVVWLDAPVGNSGRLAATLRALAAERAWAWHVELAPSPDRVLRSAPVPIATADRIVLASAPRWVDLARAVVSTLPTFWLVDLATGTSTDAP